MSVLGLRSSRDKAESQSDCKESKSSHALSSSNYHREGEKAKEGFSNVRLVQLLEEEMEKHAKKKRKKSKTKKSKKSKKSKHQESSDSSEEAQHPILNRKLHSIWQR